MDEYQSLDQQMRECRKCEGILSRKPVDPISGNETVIPKAIVTGIRPKPIMLIGQAPGLKEYETGKPFQGDAGQGIRAVLADCGVSAARFSELVYTSAVVKCFPGSKKIANCRRPGFRREDEVPSRVMVENCRPFFERQIALANPKLLLLLGSFPLKAYLRLRDRIGEDPGLENFVGRVEEWAHRKVIFLPHTSGTSRWLNDPANRELFAKAKALLRREIANVVA